MHKLGQVHSPAASQAAVFVEEHENSIQQAGFWINAPNYWTPFGPLWQWLSFPATRHNNGGTLTFADGHSQRWQYREPRTRQIAALAGWNALQTTIKSPVGGTKLPHGELSFPWSLSPSQRGSACCAKPRRDAIFPMAQYRKLRYIGYVKFASITRRRFLQTASALGAGAMGLPTLIQRSALGAPGQPSANSQLVVGLIGTGGMGGTHLANLLRFQKEGKVRLAAVCDCDDNRLEAAWENTEKRAKPYRDYRYV